jgi:Co/Zn/Cd efflux system component
MKKTLFKIHKIDCPSDEQLIRTKLSSFKNIAKLSFDLNNRFLTIYHNENTDILIDNINQLNLDAILLDETLTDEVEFDVNNDQYQKNLLIKVFIINILFFIIEIIAAYIANSMGLLADSLDMLSDAFVYSLALLAIGKKYNTKKKVALTAGFLQLFLAILGFYEVFKRFIYNQYIPSYKIMIIISVLALIANLFSFMILNKDKSNEIHINASKIFTSNDIIANIGVLLAAIIVNLTNSNIPDLIIGTIVFYLVLRGSISILKL